MAADMYGWDSSPLPVLEVPEVQEVDFFLKECMKLLVVNRSNPVHTAGLDKGHPVTPVQQDDSDDSGNPVNTLSLYLPLMYLNLSEDLK